MKVSPGLQSATRHSRREEGYVLLTILLFVALLAIAMTAMAPVITQQVKRDREEELIHRGVQYSRAIKHYVKKFGRYPTKLEDLENTNNIRFLRKRYKDPITGKDFKLLHLGEVQTSFASGIAGATSVSALAGSQAANGGFGNNSSFGGNTFGSSSGNAFGGNSGAFGGTASSFGNSGNPAQSGTSATQGNQDQGQATDVSATNPQAPGLNQQGPSANNVFGGGPIVGVVSTSKEKSIRVFNKKEHYYQWQFIYDPTSDTGGLLSTPNQPGLQSAAGGMQPGTQGPTTPNSPFGTQGPPFGQGSVFGGITSSGPPQPAPSQTQPQGPQSQFPPDQ